MGIILFSAARPGVPPSKPTRLTQVVLMHLSIPPPDPRAGIAASATSSSRWPTSCATRSAKSPTIAGPRRRIWRAGARRRFRPSSRVAGALHRSRRPAIARSCGQVVPGGQKFCGECGDAHQHPALVAAHDDAPASGKPPRGRAGAPSPPCRSPTAKEDLAFLEHHRTELRSSLTATRIVGRIWGRQDTPSARSFWRPPESAGDFVVETGPDPWWAEVGYYAARRAIGQLAGLGPAGGDERLGRGERRSASARHHRGVRTRRRPVLLASHASEAALHRGRGAALGAHAPRARRAGKSRVVLAIDDLNRVDGASRNALRRRAERAASRARPHIVATRARLRPRLVERIGARPSRGSPTSKAAELDRPYGVGERISLLPGAPDPHHTTVLPLYLDQLVRFTFEGGSSPPA